MSKKKKPSNFKNIKEYFSDTRLFVVPYYQRGYKWSLQKNAKRRDLHLKLLLLDLLTEFEKAKTPDGKIYEHHEYYLQGITVKETPEIIELVDGQQRTTSLFIILCVLKHLGVDIQIQLINKLKYDVREAANDVLQNFILGKVEGDDHIQDIAALKKAWYICNNQLCKHNDLNLFTEFLLEKIKIIYIKLDNLQNEAKVFSMMNKDKAEMSQTDLIKSNILRETSRQIYAEVQHKNNEGLEWQINEIRTKIAAEWDDWRKWWENEKHLKFCDMIAIPGLKDNEPKLSRLLNLYIKAEENVTNDTPLFEFFKLKIEDKDTSDIEAIIVFDKLKLLQSITEEWFEDIEIHNYLGLLFKGCGLEKKEDFLLPLIKVYTEKKEDFRAILKSHYIDNVIGNNNANKLISAIANDNDAYHNKYALVARQLLRMNVMRATAHKHKFDFSLYEEKFSGENVDDAKTRSLEHIKPQDFINIKKLNEEELIELNQLTNTIGNLVLIPKGLNSILKNNQFERKKEIVFSQLTNEKDNKYGLWLHSLSVFGSKSDWLKDEINDNKLLFMTEAATFYGYKL